MLFKWFFKRHKVELVQVDVNADNCKWAVWAFSVNDSVSSDFDSLRQARSFAMKLSKQFNVPMRDLSR